MKRVFVSFQTMVRRRRYRKRRYVRRRRRRRVYRGAAVRHVKHALKKRAVQSGKRIAKGIIKRKLAETFLIPAIRPKMASNKELIKRELRRHINEVKNNPFVTADKTIRLLRRK